MAISDIVGMVGAVAVLAGYLLLQLGRLQRTDRTFLLLNLCGSGAILYSLMLHFNLAATLIEAA